jgi:hypothetical protein
MATKAEDLVTTHRLLAFRCPLDLFAEVERDAALLQLSLSDIARIRLAAGSVAAFVHSKEK